MTAVLLHVVARLNGLFPHCLAVGGQGPPLAPSKFSALPSPKACLLTLNKEAIGLLQLAKVNRDPALYLRHKWSTAPNCLHVPGPLPKLLRLWWEPATATHKISLCPETRNALD